MILRVVDSALRYGFPDVGAIFFFHFISSVRELNQCYKFITTFCIPVYSVYVVLVEFLQTLPDLNNV